MYYKKARIQNPIDKYGFHEFTTYPCRKDYYHCLVKINNDTFFKSKCSKLSKYNKELKKESSKKFRRMDNNSISSNNWYRRMFDVQWELF